MLHRLSFDEVAAPPDPSSPLPSSTSMGCERIMLPFRFEIGPQHQVPEFGSVSQSSRGMAKKAASTAGQASKSQAGQKRRTPTAAASSSDKFLVPLAEGKVTMQVEKKAAEQAPTGTNKKTEAAIDAAVRRAISNHFTWLTKGEISELTVSGISLFKHVREAWVAAKKGSQKINLAASWWDALTERISGARDARELVPRDPAAVIPIVLQAGIDQCAHPNPAARKCKKLDEHLRSRATLVRQHEFCAIANQVLNSFRRTCKFSHELGLSFARHLAKFKGWEFYSEELPNISLALPGPHPPLSRCFQT